jgi:hypothetical protein
MHNLPNSLTTATRRIMAGLLLCGALCAPLWGCLIPQDNPVLIDIPPRANRPLRIAGFSPPSAQVTFKNGDCASQNQPFTLTVVDEDTADFTYSYWFVNIDDERTSPDRPNDITGGSRLRTVVAPNANNFRAKLSGLSPGTAVLTVYVSDTAFREYEGKGVITTVGRDEFFPDGGIRYQDFGYIDSHQWQLNVESCQ